MKPAAVVLLLATLACTSAIKPGLDAAAVSQALREAGLQVRDAGTVEQPFFSVPAHVFVAGDDDVQVYQFASAEEAEKAAATVAPDGTSIGTSSVGWIAPPHWFRKDRIVVNYLGSSETALRTLRELLGPQFAGQ